jgi:hypothetical protein
MTTAKELQVRPAFGVVTPGVQNDIRRPGQDVIIIDSPTEDVPPA